MRVQAQWSLGNKSKDNKRKIDFILTGESICTSLWWQLSSSVFWGPILCQVRSTSYSTHGRRQKEHTNTNTWGFPTHCGSTRTEKPPLLCSVLQGLYSKRENKRSSGFVESSLDRGWTGYYFILHHLGCFYFGVFFYKLVWSLGIMIRPWEATAGSS